MSISDLKNYFVKSQYIKKDPKLKNPAMCVYYGKYGFSVGKYTTGYAQFFYEGVNLQLIGSFCSIARNVTVTGMNHPTEFITASPIIYSKTRGFVQEDKNELINPEKNQKVIIGNDVWIGTNVTILPSVKVGDGAIIGAGTVITKSIPNYAIVAGIPGKVVKYRFSNDEILVLERSKWWNWPDDKIRKNIRLFTRNQDFIKLLINNEHEETNRLK